MPACAEHTRDVFELHVYPRPSHGSTLFAEAIEAQVATETNLSAGLARSKNKIFSSARKMPARTVRRAKPPVAGT